MYSRTVSFKLKAKSTKEFTQILEGELIPLLRRQRGFEDVISLIAPDGNEAVAISLWDQEDDAKNYDHKTHLDILKALAKVIEGVPKVDRFEVGNSTWHQIAASAVQ